MEKFDPAVKRLLKQVERQTGLEIGEDKDITLDDVMEAMINRRFFYHWEEQSFYKRQKYEDPNSMTVKIPQKNLRYMVDSVVDYLDDLYGDNLKGEISFERMLCQGEEIATEFVDEEKPVVTSSPATPATPDSLSTPAPRQPKVAIDKGYEGQPEEDSLPSGTAVSGEFEVPDVPEPSNRQRDTLDVVVPPPANEKMRKERWEKKRGKLSLDLMNDDSNVGKKALDNYLTYLEENPDICLPGKGDDLGRIEYINNFYLGPVQIRGKAIVFDYLDTLERIINEVGAPEANCFADVAIDLYRHLPSGKVNEFVDKGIRITDKEERLAYFHNESKESKEILAALYDKELVKVNDQWAQRGRKLDDERVKYSQLTKADEEKEKELVQLRATNNRQNAKLNDARTLAEDKEKVIGGIVTEHETAIENLHSSYQDKDKKYRKKVFWGVVVAFLVGMATSYSHCHPDTFENTHSEAYVLE